MTVEEVIVVDDAEIVIVIDVVVSPDELLHEEPAGQHPPL